MEDRSNLEERISALLLKVDPMRIFFEDFDNRDEYDPEAKELARLLPSCASRGACLDVVLGVFQEYFGDLIASKVDNFEALADELWTLRREL